MLFDGKSWRCLGSPVDMLTIILVGRERMAEYVKAQTVLGNSFNLSATTVNKKTKSGANDHGNMA